RGPRPLAQWRPLHRDVQLRGDAQDRADGRQTHGYGRSRPVHRQERQNRAGRVLLSYGRIKPSIAMRRFARLMFTICTAFSLLLCAAVCVLWVRSRPIDERIQATWDRWPRPDEVYSYYLAASSYLGTFELRFNREHFEPGYFR